MRIIVVTDAWLPQVNGVVRTLGTLRQLLERAGHEVCFVTPERFRTLPCPSYPEIRLAIAPGRGVARLIDGFQPCAIHIATEGPLGLAARRHCLRRGLPFTTAYHTRFPEYIQARWRVPLGLSYAAIRRFHRPASAVMVATETIERALRARGFTNIRRWTRGVDTDLYRPRAKTAIVAPRPVMLYVGRVSVEKNVDAFLALDHPGTKVVVGDGPQRHELEARYPQTRFLGAKFGEEFAALYAAADVFVFPSRTDTFGLVLLEALASGVPVAAYPVPGPLDVIADSGAGALDEDLGRAVARALAISPERCRQRAMEFSWEASADQFVANLRVFGGSEALAAAAADD